MKICKMLIYCVKLYHALYSINYGIWLHTIRNNYIAGARDVAMAFIAPKHEGKIATAYWQCSDYKPKLLL